MCKHCNRLEDDVEFATLIHDFMKLVADKLSIKLGNYVHPDNVRIMFAVEEPNEKLEISHGFQSLTSEIPGVKKVH